MKIKSAFKKGFTLVEILIVIAVLGVLAASVVVAINPLEHIARAKDSERKTNVANLFKALQASLVLGGGTYPDAQNNWISNLKTAGELKNLPGAGYLPDNSCSTSNPTEETAELQDDYCYKVNASRSKAVVYTGLESNKELEGCTGVCDTGYYVISSESLQPQVLFGSVDLQPSSEGTVDEIYHTYNEDLVGHWKMDNNANDSSSYGNNGTVNGGAVLTADRKGNPNSAYSFSGSPQYISMGDPASGVLDFGANQSFSFSAWFRTSDDASGRSWPGIIDKEEGISPRQGFNLFLSSSAGSLNKISFSIFSNNISQSRVSNNTLNDGQWHHAVGVRDIGNSKIRLYIDGALNSETDLTITGDLSNNLGFKVGARGLSNSGTYFIGQIDDVRVWNRVVTPSEVTDLHDS